MESPTNRQIATDYSLWVEYHDPNGLVSKAEFDEITIDEKLQSIADAHGNDKI